jgi:hypothetical protein
MPSLMGATCLMLALTMAAPVLAQQAPATKFDVAKLTRRNFTPAPFAAGPAQGYMKTCGQRFVCYTGIPLDCTPDTRPYENVAAHQCFCVHDGCPQ